MHTLLGTFKYFVDFICDKFWLLLLAVFAILPSLTDISISNHPFNVNQEKKDIVPVVIYSSAKALNIGDSKKLEQWIKIRIKKNKVEVFWKSTGS